jgi:hypothetical protein
MKRLPTPQATTVAALLALVALAAGVYLVAGLGWALIVASALVLLYVILPDQREVAP